MLSKERGKYFQEKWDEMEYKFANMKMKQQIDQLTNNWNELEEYIENESSKYVPTDPYIDGTNATYEEILDKMKEIKDNN